MIEDTVTPWAAIAADGTADGKLAYLRRENARLTEENARLEAENAGLRKQLEAERKGRHGAIRDARASARVHPEAPERGGH